MPWIEYAGNCFLSLSHLVYWINCPHVYGFGFVELGRLAGIVKLGKMTRNITSLSANKIRNWLWQTWVGARSMWEQLVVLVRRLVQGIGWFTCRGWTSWFGKIRGQLTAKRIGSPRWWRLMMKIVLRDVIRCYTCQNSSRRIKSIIPLAFLSITFFSTFRPRMFHSIWLGYPENRSANPIPTCLIKRIVIAFALLASRWCIWHIL